MVSWQLCQNDAQTVVELVLRVMVCRHNTKEDDMPVSSATFWFTGLSGAGKSSLADGLHDLLAPHVLIIRRIDGDELRRGPCRDLGYSEADQPRAAAPDPAWGRDPKPHMTWRRFAPDLQFPLLSR